MLRNLLYIIISLKRRKKKQKFVSLDFKQNVYEQQIGQFIRELIKFKLVHSAIRPKLKNTNDEQKDSFVKPRSNIEQHVCSRTRARLTMTFVFILFIH